MMYSQEIHDVAEEFVLDHIEGGIEYCVVYEHEDMQGEDDTDLRAVHDVTNGILKWIAKCIRAGEFDLGYWDGDAQ